jgi:hypothetical protein
MIFTSTSFEVTPGHWTWVLDGDHYSLVQYVRHFAGSEILFDNSVQTKMGLRVPSLDAQLQFSHVLLNRNLNRSDAHGARKVARSVAQLENARGQHRL